MKKRHRKAIDGLAEDALRQFDAGETIRLTHKDPRTPTGRKAPVVVVDEKGRVKNTWPDELTAEEGER